MRAILRAIFIVATCVGLVALVWAVWKRANAELTRVQLLDQFSQRPRLSPLFQHPSLEELAALPTVTTWAYPMGSARGAFIYNAQPFGTTRHLGDDLNGIGGENSDFGDDVYAIGAGRVIFAEDLEGGWGKVVIVVHAFAPAQAPNGPRRYLQSYYAHLAEIRVKPGDLVQQRQVIGTVGSADGQYLAHLHFEMRSLLNPYIGPGYLDQPPAAWISGESTLKANLASDEALIQTKLLSELE